MDKAEGKPDIYTLEQLEDVDPNWAIQEDMGTLKEAYSNLESMYKQGITKNRYSDILADITDIIGAATSLKYCYEKKRKTAPIAPDRWDNINNMLGHLCKTVGCFKYNVPKMEIYEAKGEGYVLAIADSRDLDVVEIEDPHNDDEIMKKAFDLLMQYKALEVPF